MTTEELTRVETDPLVEATEQTPPEPVDETAPEATPEGDENAGLDSVLKGLGFTEGSESVTGEGTNASADTGPRTYTEEDFEAKVDEGVKKRESQRLKDGEKRGLAVVPTRERDAIVNHLTSLGATPEQIQPVVAALNRAVGAAYPLGQTETLEKFESALWTNFADVLPDETVRKAFADRRVERHSKGEENLKAIVKDFSDTVSKAAQKDRFTKTQVNEAKRDAQRALIKKLVDAGVKVPGYSAPELGRGGTRSTSSGWNTKAQAQALHVQGKLVGGSAEMKRIRDDPTIEWGL